MEWLDSKQVKIDPPKKTKKVTGTRFATILGLNPWSTVFEMWCAITKTYEVPFEDTIYTLAGKAIEPKQAEYMKKSYGMNIITPTDRYGKNYFNKTWGDFFPENKHFGGMWDYLGVDDDTGEVDTVLEMKTTKRSEDWADGVPEYYALQAALYAYLLGVDNVIMVASFLADKDYEHPENYKPSVKNTITVEFKVSERYPDFSEKVAAVEKWWHDHVDTGISPVYDEKKDAEILAALRTNTLSPDTDIDALVKEAEGLKAEVDKATAAIAKQEKRLKKINELLKEHAMKQFRPGDKKVEVKGSSYVWTLSKTEKEKTTVNEEALKADGLYEKYTTTAPDISYRLTVSTIKEEQ
jgi:predicted phage-related endonuclease